MPTLTVTEARNNFSAVLDDLACGRENEYIVKNHNRPVAKITPISPGVDTSKRLGAAKGRPFLTDDAAFDAMDAEIAEMLGVQ